MTIAFLTVGKQLCRQLARVPGACHPQGRTQIGVTTRAARTDLCGVGRLPMIRVQP